MRAGAHPDAFPKAPHAPGCTGVIIRPHTPGLVLEAVFVDSTGRRGNGGIVTYPYRCSDAHKGCRAEVLVTEAAIRRLAEAVEVRP